MGTGYTYRCNRCNYELSVCCGIGFDFPRLYMQTVQEIRQGKYGQKWKELFENTPGAAIDAERELYVSSSCGNCKEDLNLAIYKQKKSDVPGGDKEDFSTEVSEFDYGYVMRMDLKEHYTIVKSYAHKCPECGKRMHKYRVSDQLKCPECKEGQLEMEGILMWD